ncbi:terminase [Aerococcaceae bacterium zg-ZUI334]|uniref:terminase small subunit n=1 Tax=Aerococcaceae bacterium zg-252 TaxID=2796928 RepID=UPI001B94171F|nr:terminase [Aerococcaceae bacterium zg-ZUI334]
MDRELNKQEQDFVAFLVAGDTQRQAYLKAFKQAIRWKDKTVDSRASTLFNTGKVQERYRDLLKQAKDAASNMAIWSREQAFSEYEWLKNQAKSDIEEQGVRQANSNAFLGAIEGMNNMAFRDIELADKKLKLEIEKLQAENQEDEMTITGFVFDRGAIDE